MELTNLQYKILNVLKHGYGGEWCYNYGYLESETKSDRKILQKEIKQLKELGLVKVVHGLMDDDGNVAGSGFTIPYQKYQEIKDDLDLHDR